jgi:hypothetical protein
LHHKLNQAKWRERPPQDDANRIACTCNPFQAAVNSIHLYPFVTVIERNTVPLTALRAPKRGTQWQPYMK